MTESKKKIDLPFKIIRSEVSGGFIDSVHSSFTGGIDVVNYHEDKYAHFDNESLQSPFTERWVGGKSHRHVPLNTEIDSSETRPEAWHTEFYSEGVRFYSHKKLNSPPSYWTRDELAKRPLNIKNIKNSGSYLGNYSKNYEVVQTSGRRLTNNLIVDDFRASGVLTTQFVTGSNNYNLPELNSVSGSKSVFVERFSAPGSKEESSRGALDREGEEMSPNSPLPFRSLKIRNTFYKQLSQSTPQFGGTIHNINRNSLIRAGNTQNDNGFVAHAIPRTDIQYSWISSSTAISASELGGYQSFGGNYNRAEAYTDILFNSGSLTISGSSQEYFLDNFGINSLLKDSKTINLQTKLYSISSSLSSSFSEYTSSPYSFTTWSSIRTGEHPVARALKKNNIISLQDEPKEKVFTTKTGRRLFVKLKRGQQSLNYIDPPVTNKYKPLKHRFLFKGVENEESAHELEHSYTNLLSTFSNKELSEKLAIPEKKETFYNLIYDYYINPDEQEVNPIESFLGYTYTETMWPREENVGLNETRKRAEYYLDKPGFMRDGFDIQLGTQRAFWRNLQSERKRSKNSEGGYYSSINYLSTEETGSSFTFSETGITPDNKNIIYNVNLSINSQIDNGLFNSISLLEKLGTETQLTSFNANIQNQYSGVGFSFNNLASINSRTFSFDVSGEFNNTYNDFYEEIIDESYKKSIGALYRNTLYKSLLTSLPTDRSSLTDVIIKTQDEEVFANPKLKYVAFIGGAELNTGSFVQNEQNFSNTSSYDLGHPDQLLFSLHCSGSDVYVAHSSLTTIGGESFPRIAKYDRGSNSWEALGSGPTSLSFIRAIASSGSDIYVGGSGGTYLYYYNGTSWSSVSTPGGSQVNSLALYDGKIYAGTNNTLRRYDGAGTWTTIASGLNPVYEIKVHNDVLYYAGGSSTVGFVRSWDGITDTNLGNPGGRVRALAFSGSDIFSGVTISSNAFVKKWQSPTTWNSFAPGLTGNTIYAMQVVEDKLYVTGDIDITGSLAGNYSLTTNSWSDGPYSYGNEIFDMDISGSDLYYAGDFVSPYRYLASYSTSKQKDFYLTENPFSFSQNYFSESFSESDFSFSTIDNGLIDLKSQQTSRRPFYDSYEDFVEDIRPVTKEYSILPEFRISEHMEYYIAENGSNFRAKNKSFLSIDGVGSNYRSSISQDGTYDYNFLKTYSLSDLLKQHDSIKKENESVAELETVELKISGIKKLLPYNGFYPQDRTVQLANLYADYTQNNLHGGVYNLSYENENIEDFILDTQDTGSMSSISVAKFGEKYYMATGKTNIGTSGSPYGEVHIYSTNGSDISSWNQTPITSSSLTFSPFFSTQYGSKVQLLSASNGLNLFFHTARYSLSDSQEGYILHATSSDGLNWTQPERMQINGSSAYISGSASEEKFGYYFDALYDNSGAEEKIILGIGSYKADFGATDNGLVYIVTGTMQNNLWEWSDKTAILGGLATSNNMGYGVSLVSCSSGYQAFSVEENGDSPSPNNGNIWVSTSADGVSWSVQVRIASGSVNSNIGFNNIKAVDYDDRTYLFFSEPGTGTNPGAVYVISSSASNSWSTTYSQKTKLYETGIPEDNALNPNSSYSIEANIVNNILYYSFSNYVESDNTGIDYYPGSLIVGKTTDGQTWETFEDNNIFIKKAPSEEYGDVSAFRAITTLVDQVGESEYLYTFADIHDKFTDNSKVLMVGYNSVIRYALEVSNSEKYYKHAALEPFFAPGILYNTIKSGIAVDWPCATGSNTAIVPYGGQTIVNAYYPQALEMASFSGSNINESLYGHLRSNIDYRIPFENILFPNEAFKNKDYLTEDLIRKTSLQTLPDSDPLVQFIDQTYIYGGYEPYISPIDFADFGNYGPKRFSIPFVYRKNNSTDTGLYTLAMSNFLSETVKFFLKDEKMITFSSKPDYKWKQFNSDKTYYMDIVLEKSADLVMMESYHSDLHPTGSNGEKMNGRYFGYPVNKTDKQLWAGAQYTEEEKKIIHNDPAYAPYTPPYLEGEARVRISFKPSGTSRNYTVQEIFDEATIENIFVDVAKGATTGSDAYINKMPIGSSLEIFGAAQGTEVTIDELTGEKSIRELADTQNWVISPKMETPVLDFSSQSLTEYSNDYGKTGGFGRGMWSGYGNTPASGSGIKVRLEYPYSTISSPLTASLMEQVGFKAEEKNIGSIAENKTISEAIVVIPYLKNKDANYCVSRNISGFNFIKIEPTNFDEQYKNIKQGKSAVLANSEEGIEQDIKKTSISEMIQKMEKYIIPPEMNFLQYKDIEPFVMYLFEFEHVLEQQDLVNIWQGVMPDISLVAEKDEVRIKHPSSPHDFFEGKEIPDDLRYLIFKVKRKSEINYFNVTSTTKDDSRFDFNKIIGREQGTDVYSYNWPYDYFSLVEFAKAELSLNYKKKE